MRIAQEEIFGPVLVAIPFDNDDEAARIANDVMYGPCCCDLGPATSGRAHRMAAEIDAGLLYVNTINDLSPALPVADSGQAASGLRAEWSKRRASLGSSRYGSISARGTLALDRSGTPEHAARASSGGRRPPEAKATHWLPVAFGVAKLMKRDMRYAPTPTGWRTCSRPHRPNAIETSQKASNAVTVSWTVRVLPARSVTPGRKLRPGGGRYSGACVRTTVRRGVICLARGSTQVNKPPRGDPKPPELFGVSMRLHQPSRGPEHVPGSTSNPRRRFESCQAHWKSPATRLVRVARRESATARVNARATTGS